MPWLVGSGTSARIRNNLSTIPDAMLWVDNVHFKGHGRLAMDAADQDDFIKSRGEWGRRVYATNCLTEDCVNGLTALKYNRGSTSRKIIADHFQNSEMLVDCIAADTDRSGTSAHGDIYQLTTFRLVNGIYYNVNSSELIKSGQALYYSNDRNDLTKYPTSDGLPNTLVNGLAIVNVRVQLLYGSTASWSFFAQCPFENVLVAGGSIKGGRNSPYGPVWQTGFEGKDVVVYRNVFPEATDLRAADGVTYV